MDYEYVGPSDFGLFNAHGSAVPSFFSGVKAETVEDYAQYFDIDVSANGASSPPQLVADGYDGEVLSDPSSPAQLLPGSPDAMDDVSVGMDSIQDDDSSVKVGAKRKRKASVFSPEELAAFAAKGIPSGLTADEERTFKRQRRLVKNRESAQLSRQRKKEYVGTLETKVHRYSQENSHLKRKVDDLEDKNRAMMDEINHLRGLVQPNQGNTTFDDLVAKMKEQKKNIMLNNPNNVKAAGVCLMVVLFSFGLFLNSQEAAGPMSLPRPQVTVPEVIPGATADRAYVGRVLSSKDEINTAPAPQGYTARPGAPSHIFYRYAATQGSAAAAAAPIDTTATVGAGAAAAPSAAAPAAGTTTPDFYQRLVNQPAVVDALNQLKNIMEDAARNITDPNNTTVVGSNAVTVADKMAPAFDAYFFCPTVATNAQRAGAQFNSELPTVSLVIPADQLRNSTQLAAGAEYVTLACQLTDISMFAMNSMNGTSTLVEAS